MDKKVILKDYLSNFNIPKLKSEFHSPKTGSQEGKSNIDLEKPPSSSSASPSENELEDISGEDKSGQSSPASSLMKEITDLRKRQSENISTKSSKSKSKKKTSGPEPNSSKLPKEKKRKFGTDLTNIEKNKSSSKKTKISQTKKSQGSSSEKPSSSLPFSSSSDENVRRSTRTKKKPQKFQPGEENP